MKAPTARNINGRSGVLKFFENKATILFMMKKIYNRINRSDILLYGCQKHFIDTFRQLFIFAYEFKYRLMDSC